MPVGSDTTVDLVLFAGQELAQLFQLGAVRRRVVIPPIVSAQRLFAHVDPNAVS